MQTHTSLRIHWRGERRRVLLFYGLLVLLIALHLFVLTLPESAGALPEAGEAEAHWWGFWPVRYAPGWALWLGVGLVAGAMAWLWPRAATPVSPGDRDSRSDSAPRSGGLTDALMLVITGALVCAFFAFPIAHTRWGDAYIIANAMAWPDPALRLTHSWQAPLDVFLHSQLWLALRQRFQWSDATPVYRLLSPLAGILYLLVVVRLARRKELAPAWLTFGLLSSLGVLQLFFGYVENYSFAGAGVLTYLWLGLEVLQGRRPLWLAAALLSLLNATHPSTIVLTPSLLFLGRCCWRRGGLTVGRALLEIGLPVVLVAGGTIALMEVGGHGLTALLGGDRPGGGDGRWLVPLLATTTRWEHYTLFSWPHLRDFLNEQMLVAPVVLPGLLLLWLGTIRLGKRSGTDRGAVQDAGFAENTDFRRFYTFDRPRTAQGQSSEPASSVSCSSGQSRFLLIAAICYWLFAWFWNPDYGGQRDWDLFSLSVIPGALLLVWWLPRFFALPPLLRAVGWPLVLLQALHSAAFVYQNRLPWQWPG